MRRVCKNAIISHSNMSSMQERDISVVDLIYTVGTQKPSMFVFTLLNALSYFHFLFQVQIKTWFLYTLRTSFEISKQTCMYSYTNILNTLLLTYILQCKNKEYSSFVIISCKVYLKVMNNVFRLCVNQVYNRPRLHLWKIFCLVYINNS